jgi:hypothetical protein
VAPQGCPSPTSGFLCDPIFSIPVLWSPLKSSQTKTPTPLRTGARTWHCRRCSPAHRGHARLVTVPTWLFSCAEASARFFFGTRGVNKIGHRRRCYPVHRRLASGNLAFLAPRRLDCVLLCLLSQLLYWTSTRYRSPKFLALVNMFVFIFYCFSLAFNYNSINSYHIYMNWILVALGVSYRLPGWNLKQTILFFFPLLQSLHCTYWKHTMLKPSSQLYKNWILYDIAFSYMKFVV